jgi:hypothetical protein
LATLRNALVMLLALCALSCAVTPRPSTSPLLGKWRSENRGQIGEYFFLADGTFSGSVTSNGTVLAKFTGVWSLQDGVINYEYRSDVIGNIAPGTKDQDKLIEISSERYTIQAANGSRRIYKRVSS